MFNKRGILFSIKTVMAVVFYFTTLNYILGSILDIANYSYLITTICFLIYVFYLCFVKWNFYFSRNTGNKISVQIIDYGFLISAFIIFIPLTIGYFTSAEGYWVWLFYPSVASIFFFGTILFCSVFCFSILFHSKFPL
jgi:hypothetical protein